MAALDERVSVGVAVLVFNGRGEVLLGRRKGKHGNGLWAAPGGKPDPGERPEDAAVRETFEETGILLGGVLAVPEWTYNRFDGDGHGITIYYAAYGIDAPAETMEPDKCEGWRWFAHRFKGAHGLPAPLWPGIETAITRAKIMASLTGVSW